MKYNLLAYKVFINNYLSSSDDDVDIYFEDVLVYSFGLKENLTTHQALQYGKLNNPED